MSPTASGGADAAPPRIAALFWFYHAFDACRDRLELLRRLNPGTPVFALYGGPRETAEAARAVLGDLCDDFHAYDGPEDSHWKWIHGDRLLADWHARRGRELAWDSVLVVQWDLLLAAPLSEVLAGLRVGEAVFPGDRPLDEVAGWWGWAGGGGAWQAREMAGFRALLRERFGYDGPLWCCLFLAAVLPRAFLDRYVAEGAPEPGFLEYKLPTLARLWGTPVRALRQFTPWWRADPLTRDAPAAERVLNATRDAVDPALIAAELAKPDGRRVFHPVFETPWAALAPAGLAAAPPAGRVSPQGDSIG